MTTTFDLRLATLRTAYAEGTTTPRQLILGLRDKAAALNGEFNTFIHLMTAQRAGNEHRGGKGFAVSYPTREMK